MANADIKVVVTKQMVYRGGTRLFTNSYHANGGVPADNAHWNTLFDAIVNGEKAATMSDETITLCRGYVGAGTVAVHEKAYTTAGTQGATGVAVPADVAAIIRYSTAARTSTGRPIYLFNYYHGTRALSTDRDKLDTTLKTAMATYAALWDTTGFSDGTNTFKRAGPRGADATGHVVGVYLTHRDFPH